MSRQYDDIPQGWYDGVMKHRLYDELVPSYLDRQAQVVADSAPRPLCTALVAAVRVLARVAWRLSAWGRSSARPSHPEPDRPRSLSGSLPRAQ
jgi:hypothetical protein